MKRTRAQRHKEGKVGRLAFSALIDYQAARSPTWLTSSTILPLSLFCYSLLCIRFLVLARKHPIVTMEATPFAFPCGSEFLFRFVVVIQMTEWPSWVFSPACLSLSLSPSLSFSFPVCFFLCFSSFILLFTLSCPKWWRCLPVRYLLIGPKENQCRQSYKHTTKKETGILVHLLNGVREAASNRNSAEPTKSARLNCVSLPLSLVLVRPTCVFHRHREIIH